MLYCRNHGLTKTSLRYHVGRKCVWKWRNRWDGTWQSLLERKRSPHTNPRKQSRSEEKLVKRYGRQYREDLLLGYQKARNYGYTRSYGCFKRTVTRLLGKQDATKRKDHKPSPTSGRTIRSETAVGCSMCLHTVCRMAGNHQFTAKDECAAGLFGRCTMNAAPTARGTFWRNW